MRKAFAIGCIGLILGAQAGTILPPGGEAGRWRGWYWPFLDYPMYSRAHHQGDSIVLQDLRAVRCDAPDTALSIQPTALHLEPWRFWTMLDALARSPERKAAIVDTLGHLTRAGIDADVCSLQLWRQVVIVDRRGVQLENQPWVRFLEWMIRPDSGQRALAPSGPRP